MRWPNLDENLCIKIFFMVLNNNFLTPNTYCYIRPIDTIWCHDTRVIAGYNWCKIVYDNMREAGHKWKVAWCLRTGMSNVLGCSLFLMVQTCYTCNSFSYIYLQFTQLTWYQYTKWQILYLDHLMLQGELDATITPRWAYYTSEVIMNFIHAGERRLGRGHTWYDKCEINLYIVLLICYSSNYPYKKHQISCCCYYCNNTSNSLLQPLLHVYQATCYCCWHCSMNW
jgi:hypothetical protein